MLLYDAAVSISRQCGSSIGRDQSRRADGRRDVGCSSQDSEYRTRIEGEPFTVAPRRCVVYDLVCLWTQGRRRADVKMEELLEKEEAEEAAAADEDAAAAAESKEADEEAADELMSLVSAR